MTLQILDKLPLFGVFPKLILAINAFGASICFHKPNQAPLTTTCKESKAGHSCNLERDTCWRHRVNAFY